MHSDLQDFPFNIDLVLVQGRNGQFWTRLTSQKLSSHRFQSYWFRTSAEKRTDHLEELNRNPKHHYLSLMRISLHHQDHSCHQRECKYQQTYWFCNWRCKLSISALILQGQSSRRSSRHQYSFSEHFLL